MGEPCIHCPSLQTSQTCLHVYNEVLLGPQQGNIRLFSINPGKPENLIEGQLFVASLDRKPNYIALSYVWGDTRARHSILVNGHTFGVTSNLFVALRRLRNVSSSVTVWVDAIAIDQHNLDERGHQVAQMARIFKDASRVLAWLGEQGENSELAVEFIVQASSVNRMPSPPTYELQAALDRFWMRPYWNRIWVIQELALASDHRAMFQCGDLSFSFDVICNFIRLLRQYVPHSDYDSSSRPSRITRISVAYQNLDFLEILWNAARCEATDPRDRVFGLLGLMAPRYRALLTPNYNIPLSHMVTDVLSALISLDSHLNLLCYFACLGSRGIPSWLPCLDEPLDGLFPGSYFCSGSRQALAFIKGNVLHARGVKIAEVITVRQPRRFPGTSHHSPNKGQELESVSNLDEIEHLGVTLMKERYPDTSSSAVELRFWDTVANNRHRGLPDSRCPYTPRQLWDIGIAYERDPKRTSTTSVAGFPGAHFNFVFGRLLARSFFTTSSGDIGVGPKSLLPGDLICVLFGCNLAMVLRKSGQFVTFVGPAYMDGAMGGEYCKQPHEEIDFLIC